MKTLSIYNSSKNHVIQCVPIDFKISNERSSQDKKILEVNLKFQGDLSPELNYKHLLYFKIYAVLEIMTELKSVSLIKYKVSHLETLKKRRDFSMKKISRFIPEDVAKSIAYSLKSNDIFANPMVEKDELLNYLIMLNNGEIDSE